MRVRVDPRGGPASQLFDLMIRHVPDELYQPQYLCGLTEHDLRRIEFALALRRAMARVCPAENGEHACALSPGHDGAHLCQACTERWL